MTGLRYLQDVVTLEYDPEKCVGCGMCREVCPHSVFVMDGEKASLVDRDACIECGACALNCPSDAITVDSGVGCAAAILNSLKQGKGFNDPNPTCDCSKGSSCCG
ncbi:mercury methylation ferredoxin HgcB [Candidatus Latescibacterota bacterium]